jgi:hypothetical protein
MYEPGQEIIHPLAVSDHPCHIKVLTGLPVVAVDTSTTESRSRPFILARETLY